MVLMTLLELYRSRGFVQLIANAANRQDVARVLRIGFKFLTQPIDVWVNVALVTLILSAPNPIQQTIARPGAARFRSKQLQNLKLERRKIDSRALPKHFMSAFVDYQIADLDAFTVSLSFAYSRVSPAIVRSAARFDRTYTLQSSA